MNLNSIYTPKQIEILKACLNTDWFMLINHRGEANPGRHSWTMIFFCRS